MRKHGRVDGNQNYMVDKLRRLGVSVAITSSQGSGFPDIVCGYKGVNLLVEIKDPDKPPSARKLTELEESFKESWRGSYIVATDFEQVWEWYQASNSTKNQTNG